MVRHLLQAPVLAELGFPVSGIDPSKILSLVLQSSNQIPCVSASLSM